MAFQEELMEVGSFVMAVVSWFVFDGWTTASKKNYNPFNTASKKIHHSLTTVGDGTDMTLKLHSDDA